MKKLKNGKSNQMLFWLLCGLFSLGLICPQFTPAAEWPTKSITVNVGVTPGGFTDTYTRAVTLEMSKILGVPIVVVNMPGGGGGIAAENSFRAPNDGYTWHAQGSAFRTFAVMGLHTAAPKDWYCVPTITYIGAIAVREDSPYKSFPQLIEALKKDPGKIPFAASPLASCWRVSMEIMRKVSGLPGRLVVYPGAATSLTALLSKDIEYVMCGIGEQAELLKGKKVRALAAFDDKPYRMEGYGVIPPITDYIPEIKKYLPYQGWSSISLRGDIPNPILKKIDDAFLKAIQTKSVKEYCKRFEADMIGLVGEDAQKLYLKQASLEAWLLHEVNFTKKSPEDFKIPKPF